MSILYQLPQNSYSGTELGSASSVFCNQIASAIQLLLVPVSKH